MKNPIVTLLTDFGTKDHYVASMKGVILRINPLCTLIDITHQIKPQDVEEGAFVLASAFSYFPKGTIHLAVVDPEVGGPRNPILLVTQNYFFIGPDNGLFTQAAKREGVKRIVVLNNIKYFLHDVSATFHGRDIFAPVAGYLSLGTNPQTFGERTDHWVELDLKKPELRGGKLIGEIIQIDAFGNLTTNIDRELFLQYTKNHSFLVRVGKRMIEGLTRRYGEGEKNEPITLFGNGGFLEIAVRDGNAQKRLKVKRGDRVFVQNTRDD